MRRRTQAAVALLMVAGATALSSAGQAQEVVRGPYLQNVSTTETTVVFDVSEPVAAEVRVEGAAGEVLHLPSPAGRHHEVRVAGLEPDQQYHYAVTLDGAQPGSAELTLHTAVLPGTSFPMVILGDTRSGDAEHAAIVAAVQQEAPRLAINTGDLVADGGVDEQWDTFFAIESPLISQVPLYPVVGNHDTYRGDAPNFRDAFALPGNELYYSFDYGNAHFVIVDGHASTELACVKDDEIVLNCFDETQLGWLEADLEAACEREETRWVFVAVHEGPYSSKSDRYGSSQMRELLPLFGRLGVTAIFSGHDHYYERGVSDNGVPYVITGGAGAGLYDLAEPCDFPHTVVTNSQVHHFVSLDVQADSVRLVAKQADGTVIDETTFDTPKSCSAAVEPAPAEPPPSAAADGGCGVAGYAVDERSAAFALAWAFALGWWTIRRRRRR
ncbi:MAG: metallophosphoesterase [Deltaproteobacteria bacterium]|jgi:hypothetical protein|nr:metallophosphoesterase [Deltaproteobacteria bacterium]MBW2532168.1 metallophosphoesterase [Deltaproteobacteria bacterium]